MLWIALIVLIAQTLSNSAVLLIFAPSPSKSSRLIVFIFTILAAIGAMGVWTVLRG